MSDIHSKRDEWLKFTKVFLSFVQIYQGFSFHKTLILNLTLTSLMAYGQTEIQPVYGSYELKGLKDF